MAVQASKSISLTVDTTGGTLKLSADNIVKFTASGSKTLLTYLTNGTRAVVQLMSQSVATINTAAARTQAVTLNDGNSTVIYIHSDKIIYLDTVTAGTNILYWNPAKSAPDLITVTEIPADINTAAGNLLAITTQPTDRSPSATRYINNKFVTMITGEAIGTSPSITFTTKVKTGTGLVTTPGSGYTSLAAAITGGGGTGATGTVTGLAISGVPSAAGTGYVAGTSVITITGGTAATASKFNVTHTKVVSATVAAGGTGDLGDGAGVIVVGTTGTGTKFRASVTIATNAIASVQSITIAGDYTVNPTVIAAEPVTYVSGASSGTTLTGAQLSVLMGALTLTLNTAGDYSVLPTNPAAQGSATGGGTGATITVSWGILAFTITGAGTGFTSYPTFSVTGAGGTGAVITASMQVESPMTVVDGGSNINTAPTLTFSATTGTLATATATLDPDAQTVTDTTLTNAGSYKSGTDAYPFLTISGGAGAQIMYDDKKTSQTILQVEETATTVQTAINAL